MRLFFILESCDHIFIVGILIHKSHAILNLQLILIFVIRIDNSTPVIVVVLEHIIDVIFQLDCVLPPAIQRAPRSRFMHFVSPVLLQDVPT